MADSIKRLGKYGSVVYSLKSLIQRASELLNCGVIKHEVTQDIINTVHDSNDHLTIYIHKYNLPDGATLLRNVRLNISQGENIIITGENGSGKSTLLNIILNLQPATNDSVIRLNGKDIQAYSESAWLSHFTLMNQQTQIIKGSLRENLMVADTGASDKELITALLTSGGDILFNKFHRNLSARIAEKGTSLSGGEKQIIGLRASF